MLSVRISITVIIGDGWAIIFYSHQGYENLQAVEQECPPDCLRLQTLFAFLHFLHVASRNRHGLLVLSVAG